MPAAWGCPARLPPCGLQGYHPVTPWCVLGCVPGVSLVQIPIGLEEFHEGVVDLVRRRALTFGGPKGQEVVEGPVPPELEGEVEARRAELVERVSEVRRGLWGWSVCIGSRCPTSGFSPLHEVQVQHKVEMGGLNGWGGWWR